MLLVAVVKPLSPSSPFPPPQHLDQLLSIELFQFFLRDAYRGSLSELNSKLVNDLECQKLLHQVQEYYRSERLYGLRCLKHLLGYWQDPNHPYQVLCSICNGLLIWVRCSRVPWPSPSFSSLAVWRGLENEASLSLACPS